MNIIANQLKQKFKILKIFVLTLFILQLVGCGVSPMSDQYAKISNAKSDDIVAAIKNGTFKWNIGTGSDFADQRSTACDWIWQGKREAIKALIDTSNQNVEALLNTLPMLACVNNVEDYNYYKKLGAKVHQYGESNQYDFLPDSRLPTPLTEAVANGNVIAVSLLIADGASIEAIGRNGLRPLGYALAIKSGFLYENNLSPRAGRWPAMQTAYWFYIFPIDIDENEIPENAAFTLKHARFANDSINNLNRIIRILLESGANPNSTTVDFTGTHNADRYELLTKTFSNDQYFTHQITQQKQLESIQLSCRQDQQQSCHQWVAETDELSIQGREARKFLDMKGREQANWMMALANQNCQLNSEGWLYQSEMCKDGLAHGKGRANSRDRISVIDGTFLKGEIISGRLNMHDNPYFEGNFVQWMPEGVGTCWYEMQPEECVMSNGKRIDTLHKSRVELQKQKEEMQLNAQRERNEQLARDMEEARYRRERLAEEKREYRNEQAIAAAISVIKGDYTGNTQSGGIGTETLVIQKKMHGMDQEFLSNQRRLQERTEQARLAASSKSKQLNPQDTSSVGAERTSKDNSVSLGNTEYATQEAENKTSLELQNVVKNTVATLNSELDEDRQASEQQLAEAKLDYLVKVKNGIQMKAVTCYGKKYVTGSRLKVTLAKGLTNSCVDVSVSAWCPGDRVGRPVLARNYIGMAGCFGDIYEIEPTPACDSQDIRVLVEDVQYCR
jgi:hypothetical protein